MENAKMPTIVLVGAQWGDEGKGKVTDVLTPSVSHVVRGQGGNNAGHTILFGGQEFSLHLIPSGLLHPHTQCYIGAGTVVDPTVLLREMIALKERGIDFEGRLWISESAHVIFPYHKILDGLEERSKGKEAVGTTGRGIGPCYVDKAKRVGIRMGELVRPELLHPLLAARLKDNQQSSQAEEVLALSLDEIFDEYSQLGQQLAPFVRFIEKDLFKASRKKEGILLEGAQGTFLDIGLGTYPYVTSSNTIAAGICAGAGLGPSSVDHVLGIVKAYTTRVGAGGFPTETAATDLIPNHEDAREKGTTTGRLRRIGWFDAVMVAQAVAMNGLDSLAITKIDVLDRCEKIKICVAYELDGRRLDHLPSLPMDVERVQPIYEELPGWLCSTEDAKSFEELPEKAQAYLKRIEDLCQAPISLISVGPDREKTFFVGNHLPQSVEVTY